MYALVLLGVFGATLLVVLAIATLARWRELAVEGAARARLEAASGGMRRDTGSILRDESRPRLPLLEAVLGDRGARLLEALDGVARAAGTSWHGGEVAMAAAGASLVGAILGATAAALPGALLGAVLGMAAPIVVLRRRAATRRKRATAQLPDLLELLVNALSAGHSLPSALEFAARETPAPLGPEFLRMHDELRLGLDMRTALGTLQQRLPTEELRLLVTALLLQRETGGNLAELLGTIGTTVRTRLAFEGQLATLTAEPKLSAWVLSALPVLVLALLRSIAPEYTEPLFTTPLGHMLLAGAAGLIAVAAVVLSRIADVRP